MGKRVITFHYELKDKEGQMIESSRQGEPLAFLEGAGQIIPGLENALIDLEKGSVKDIFVPYQEAYGAYDQTLVGTVPKNQFPTQEIQAGDMFQVEKNGAMRIVTVVEVTNDTVVLDANHPMAGKDLNFSVEVMEKRDATADEIAHGHAHGPHSHH